MTFVVNHQPRAAHEGCWEEVRLPEILPRFSASPVDSRMHGARRTRVRKRRAWRDSHERESLPFRELWNRNIANVVVFPLISCSVVTNGDRIGYEPGESTTSMSSTYGSALRGHTRRLSAERSSA
jgi:hypothetical protein